MENFESVDEQLTPRPSVDQVLASGRPSLEDVRLKLRLSKPSHQTRKRSNSVLSSQTDESSHTVISKRSIQTDLNKALPRAKLNYLEDDALPSSSRSMNKLTLGQPDRSKDFKKKAGGPLKKRNLESVSEVG